MIPDPKFFRNELLGFVIKKVRNKSLAEDIVHDVFIKVQANSSHLKEREKLLPWIYRITKNAIIDHFRSQSRTINATDVDWDSDYDDLNQCVERCIAAKMATLPDKYREALELSEMQGLSQLDLAKRLNISYSGAKSRVQRARQLLKDGMERDYLVKLDGYGNVLHCSNKTFCNC